jgi:hypothetical protein
VGNNYTLESFLGRTLILYQGTPVLLVNGRTNALAILKILECDEYGETYRYDECGVQWRDEREVTE